MLNYFTTTSGFIYFIFAVVVLFKKSPLRKQNRILGIVFLLMSAYSVYISNIHDAINGRQIHFLQFYFPVEYVWAALMGPLFYMYIVRLLKIELKLSLWVKIAHILPILPPVSFLLYFASQSVDNRILLLFSEVIKGGVVVRSLNLIFYLQMIVYLLLSGRYIYKQIKITPILKLENVFYDISWLRTLIVMDLVIMFLTLPLVLIFPSEINTNLLAQLVMDIQLVYILFKSFWENGLFPKKHILPEETFNSINTVTVPALKIKEEIVEELSDKLMQFMVDKKPYLKEDCTLQMISDGTGISIHYLSSILNRKFERNFSDFVNEFRVEEAKKILQSSKHSKMTIEAIGFECGFGSKSNFNKAFKKLTNMTPSQFKSTCKVYNS